MLNVPSFSGANPDVATYGYVNGMVRTVTRLGSGASAGASLVVYRDSTRQIVRPVLDIYGDASSFTPDPGTYDPCDPKYGMFFAFPYSGSNPNWVTAVRVRLRSPATTNPNVSISYSTLNSWRNPAVNPTGFYADTANYVGTASCLLDVALDGGTTVYQTYLLQFTFTS